MSCGNKTDECPKCRKYIRRAVFAYHYENNCANLDDADTPTPRSRNSSAHHNSNRPAVGEDNDNYRPKVSEKSNYLFYFHILWMFYSSKKLHQIRLSVNFVIIYLCRLTIQFIRYTSFLRV